MTAASSPSRRSRPPNEPGAGAALLAAILPAARAQVVHIRWSADGRFAHHPEPSAADITDRDIVLVASIFSGFFGQPTNAKIKRQGAYVKTDF